MLHQAWSDGSFFPASNRSALALVESGSTLVWTVEAATWAEAMTRYHEWRGWEPYKPAAGDSGADTVEPERAAADIQI